MKPIYFIIFGIIIIIAICSYYLYTRSHVAAATVSQQNSSQYKLADTYMSLRGQAFKATSSECGQTVMENESYGAIIEIGMDAGIDTIVVFKSGDASMYFSNGGGYIGGAGHQNIRDAAIRTVAMAQDQIARMKPTARFPIVAQGNVRVYVLTPNGIYYDEAELGTVFDKDSAARVIFGSIQDVIHGFMQLDEKQKKP